MTGQITLEGFMLFLIVASRLYDPLNATLQNLAAIISCESRVDRLNNINDYKLQTGEILSNLIITILNLKM